MAEIKSSIEIAMERAAAMGAAADDQARDEGRRKGRALASRFGAGELDAEGLAGELAGLGADEAGFARAAGAEAFWEELAAGDPVAVACIAVLAQGGDAAGDASELAAITRAKREREYQLLEELSIEMAQSLAASGIKGSAVIPNPTAHPELGARLQALDAEWADQRAALLQRIGRVMLQD